MGIFDKGFNWGGVASDAFGVSTLGVGAPLPGQRQAAQAAQRQAEEALAQRQEERRVAMDYAQATPSELMALEEQHKMYQQQIAASRDALSRKTKILGMIDPSIMSAYDQTYKILSGQETAMLSPLYRDIEANQRMNQAALSRTMGQGYEQSSAGQYASAIQASQAGLAKTQAGMSALQALSQFGAQQVGVGEQVSQGAMQQTALAGNLGTNYIAALGDLQKRMISASEATTLTPFVGANNLAAVLSGQATSQNAQQLLSAAGGVAGAMAGAGSLGGGAPKTSPNSAYALGDYAQNSPSLSTENNYTMPKSQLFGNK